jgi:uncharacterized protein
MPTSSFLRLALLVGSALVFFVLPSTTDLAADWLWFGEVGYRDVFLTGVTARSAMFAVIFVVAALWMWLHLRRALSSLSAAPIHVATVEGYTVALPTQGQLRPLVAAAAVLIALAVALYGSSSWFTFLAWQHGKPFGVVDPILGHDTGFYIFTLPLLHLIRNVALGLVLLAAAGATAIYVVAGKLALTPFGLRVQPEATRHGAVLASALFLVLALSAWLDRLSALVTPGSLIHGAAYSDVYARMPAAFLLMIVALIGAVLAAVHVTGRARWPLPAAAALYLVTLFGGQVYGALIHRFVVAPNEQAREAPFIAHNIAGTRAAFGLDRIEERELTGDAELSRADVERNRGTLDNVRLWDHQPLLETFGQIQEIRTYYDFVAVDNDRYVIDGRQRQVMLSARELNSAALPNRTWINERLVFTHGHGLTLGPVNQVTSEGLPVLFVRDLPPTTTVDINVSQPSIYFGELSNEYVIARTRSHEFHYPKGDDNVFTDYDGSGGILIDSFLRKLLFAIRFRDYQILLSDDITNESRLMFDRQIRRRVSKIAPFLVLDNDPYLVVSDQGRLVWLQDAYTTSGRYPYSTAATPGINYIRNSVKIVIDAYDGTTTYYVADDRDPIVQTLASIFPSLFKPLTEMPPTLRQHVRYPEDLFAIQTAVYSTYHMTNPAVFYNKEDQWEVPAIDRGGETVGMQPYYTIMKLPGEKAEEFIQMLPFTPRRRDNLASWMVARSDAEHYGQLVVFQFPKQKLVFGPRQVVARMSQDQVIAPQITLWNQQGSEVIQGTLMVIPIEESLIYVRPLYLRAQAGRIPELTRVVVAYQNRIVMEPTLDAGLARLFGGPDAPRTETQSAATPTPEAPTDAPTAAVVQTLQQLSTLADEAYRRAVEAQRAGDWAKYGEEIKRLGEILVKMRAQ